MPNYVVPFVNYPRMHRNHHTEYESAICGCLHSGDLLFRSDLIKFENNFAQYCGCKYGIGTGSCSNALFLSLKALGIGPGDEVITIAHTFVATVDAIISCGATPILVDVNESDMLMDMDKAAQAMTSRTKAIIPVHLNGRMCDMDKWKENDVADQRIHIIEDAAQAPGASLCGRRAGSWGVLGCFSFYPAKVLGSFGDGGMITTNDKPLYETLLHLRSHGEPPPYLCRNPNKEIRMWGHHSRLDNVAAAYLNVKMKYLNDCIYWRRAHTDSYNHGLDGFPITLPSGLRVSSRDVYQNYVIRLDSTGTRDSLKAHLESRGVETLISWPIPLHKQPWPIPLHKQPALQADIGHFDLPVTERISKTCLSLPLYPELTDEEIRYVIRAVRSYFT